MDTTCDAKYDFRFQMIDIICILIFIYLFIWTTSLIRKLNRGKGSFEFITYKLLNFKLIIIYYYYYNLLLIYEFLNKKYFLIFNFVESKFVIP